MPNLVCRLIVPFGETGEEVVATSYANPTGMMIAATLQGVDCIGVCLGTTEGCSVDDATRYIMVFSDTQILHGPLKCLIFFREHYRQIRRPAMEVLLVDASVSGEYYLDWRVHTDKVGNVSMQYSTAVADERIFGRTTSVAKGVVEEAVSGMCVGRVPGSNGHKYLVVFSDYERGEFTYGEMQLMRKVFLKGVVVNGLEPISVSI